MKRALIAGVLGLLALAGGVAVTAGATPAQRPDLTLPATGWAPPSTPTTTTSTTTTVAPVVTTTTVAPTPIVPFRRAPTGIPGTTTTTTTQPPLPPVSSSYCTLYATTTQPWTNTNQPDQAAPASQSEEQFPCSSIPQAESQYPPGTTFTVVAG